MKTPVREPHFLGQRDAGQGGVGGEQHQHLLRQRLPQFPRRNAEAVGGDVEFVQVEARERLRV